MICVSLYNKGLNKQISEFHYDQQFDAHCQLFKHFSTFVIVLLCEYNIVRYVLSYLL